MRDTFRRLGPTELSVVILGESGTGKEVIARAIHYWSNRHDKLFFAVNCAGIPDTLAESQLFGHVKGIFTGAINDHEGYFEQANGGTLFSMKSAI